MVLMFALIAAHGWQATQAGRLGAVAFGVAIVGTMLPAGDLWFESFAVPWLAAGPGGEALTGDPSTLMAVGAISSYLLFAAGWTLFGIAGARARVFPVAVSIALVIGGIVGFRALLAPGGIPLGAAVVALGTWMLVHGPADRRPSAGVSLVQPPRRPTRSNASGTASSSGAASSAVAPGRPRGAALRPHTA
jgi:hypothetical protein